MNARSPQRLAAPMRRLLTTVVSGGLLAVGLTAFVTAPAEAALPPQCTQVGATVTCTYLKAGGNQTLDVPDGVPSVQVKVVGEAGTAGTGTYGGTGGRGAVVTGTVALDS